MAPGEGGNFIALGQIPASVVAPLGALSIMFSALLGRFLLNERLLMRGYYGAAVLMVGAVLVIASTPDTPAPSGLDELEAKLWGKPFLAFSSVIISGAVLARTSTKLLPNVFLMGVIACYCALSTKTVSFMIQTGDHRWDQPLALGVLGSLVTTVVLQIIMFQKVLSRFGVSLVVPLHFVQYTILVSVGATLLYGELLRVPATNFILFIAGCCLCFGGSWLVSSARGDASSDHTDDNADTTELEPLAEESA
mmetsp:Transcript_14963/g.32517  ORF Transcript_14963/g.32517 Transcript_14963/m.32517 type:complete len:251 (-) Transcript_14963:29-781(-)